MAQRPDAAPHPESAALSTEIGSTETGGIRRENRRRILCAAEQVFAEQGFSGATTAAIALKAGLPKANLHYYFGTKRELYRAVLSDILKQWLEPLARMEPDSDPAMALADYIRLKMRATRERPAASRLFANEIMRGAVEIGEFLRIDLKQLVDQKCAVLEGWMAEGRMAPIDPRNFLFMIWAATQHYADFDVQVRAVLGRPDLSDAEFDAITGEVVRFLLRGAGVAPA